MSVNALYTSIGRIRTMIMFDTKRYRLREGSIDQAYKDVIDHYGNIVKGLNQFHPDVPVRLLVFLTINRHGPVHGEWFDPSTNIHCIPVNSENPQSSIPSRWAQDVIGVLQNNTLHVGSTVDKWLSALLANKLQLENCERLNGHCVGGNIRRGLRGSNNYILKSTGGVESCTEESLHALTGVPTHRITSIFHNANVPSVAGTMFHADMYTTLVGNIGLEHDLVLVAKPYQETTWTELNNALDALVDRLEHTQHGNKKAFRVERLPIVMINDENSRFTHAFSYNNCLVENYVEDGTRYVNFYFPDFRHELKRFSGNNKFLIEYFGQKNIAPIGHNKEHEHKEPNLDVAALDGVEQEIIADLKAIFVDVPNVKLNVKFVKHNFRSLSQSRGGLHCLVKVVERDLIA